MYETRVGGEQRYHTTVIQDQLVLKVESTGCPANVASLIEREMRQIMNCFLGWTHGFGSRQRLGMTSWISGLYPNDGVIQHGILEIYPLLLVILATITLIHLW